MLSCGLEFALIGPLVAAYQVMQAPSDLPCLHTHQHGRGTRKGRLPGELFPTPSILRGIVASLEREAHLPKNSVHNPSSISSLRSQVIVPIFVVARLEPRIMEATMKRRKAKPSIVFLYTKLNSLFCRISSIRNTPCIKTSEAALSNPGMTLTSANAYASKVQVHLVRNSL